MIKAVSPLLSKLNRLKSLHKKKLKASRVIPFIVMIIGALIMLYPLLIIANISLKSYKEYLEAPLAFVKTFTFSNYLTVWEDMEVVTRTFHTIWLTVIACTVNTLICLLAAFPISRNYFKGSDKVYTFILASMFFPGSLIATITLLKNLGLYGYPPALLLIWGLASIQLNTFMLVGFIKTLPKDLDDAAFIDGCGYFRYIFTVCMPLLTPIIATIVVLKAIGCWNDFLSPYIYMGNSSIRTLSTGLYLYMGQFSSKWNMLSSAIFIVALPMIILYIFTQKFIIEGMTSGALKG